MIPGSHGSDVDKRACKKKWDVDMKILKIDFWKFRAKYGVDLCRLDGLQKKSHGKNFRVKKYVADSRIFFPDRNSENSHTSALKKLVAVKHGRCVCTKISEFRIIRRVNKSLTMKDARMFT